ncbi:PREDICTED: probable LRR receptor-like serine/threonine-protein kinase At1g07560 [Camelina sativa]|uniref:Probable LRR receptor-like serine/threonine-protein kinase At1g07560 n=1 Tax=Camelina sativa TaxID=90675 RepID=A0ABM1QG71_CAMSA|nr:PREDICTED: probable LRR receptor-like serine/threonine-protein kinase At1g07560 [Camelina sativa]
MESSYRLLLVFLVTFATIHFVQAQDEGFISLDCGLSRSEQSPYTESATGLQYSSDSSYIQTGKIARIQRDLEGPHLKPQTTVRYFPDGIRNCYNITVKQGTKYMIRVRAIYGNYDGLNTYPRFDLYIGPNFWITLDTKEYVRKEIVHIPRSNMLDLCLVKTDTSTPFISAIEMRPLPNNSYITTSGSLKLFSRYYFSNLEDILRYSEDVYDRMWNYYNQTDWKQISTSLTVNTSDSFRLPQNAIKTAATSANASEPLIDIEFPESANDKVYIYLHFAEVEALKANETREFDISLNGESIKESYKPLYLQSETNLSSNGLTGTIDAGIQNLTHLEKLDLSNNSLTGLIPEFLANMKSLMIINLSKNQLNDSIPQALRDREKEGLKLSVDGHAISCLPGSCVSKKKFPVLIVALVASVVVVVIVMVLVFIFVFRKKKTSDHVEAIPRSAVTTRANFTSTNTSETSIETKKRRFSYAEVMQMTNNLERALGEGGFGVVYHGYLNGSQQVAVKVLSESSSQGYKHFKAEVELLLRVHHINLVNLVGYCDERDHLALIYEYMPSGDLKEHLSGKRGGSVLNWTTRLRIAADAALGLEYLHIGCQPSMVHRDVKSTNILLGEQFSAKIADFGLSRSFQLGDESHVSTVVAGTPGYLDPEYYRTGRLAEMSDVYSFGIVLLEIITNQRVIDQSREKPHITEWTAFMLNRGDITRIMDPKLHGDYNSRSVWRAVELAMLCANPSSEKRPTMSQVVIELKECLSSENSMKGKNQDTESHGSFEMSMSFDTKAVPSAR